MAHHSEHPPSDSLRDQLRDLARPGISDDIADAKRQLQLGATGKYPRGKLDQHDAGAIMIAVANTGREVIINFGTPVVWVGFTPEQAMGIADLLRSHAEECGKEKP